VQRQYGDYSNFVHVVLPVRDPFGKAGVSLFLLHRCSLTRMILQNLDHQSSSQPRIPTRKNRQPSGAFSALFGRAESNAKHGMAPDHDPHRPASAYQITTRSGLTAGSSDKMRGFAGPAPAIPFPETVPAVLRDDDRERHGT
jgi:hypothetical protein